MDNFKVTFEMVNGEKHTYEFHNTTEDEIYTQFVQPSDGWIELTQKGEKHYIQADKITRVKIISESLRKERSEKTAKAIQSFRF
jgi:hypothetical protein